MILILVLQKTKNKNKNCRIENIVLYTHTHTQRHTHYTYECVKLVEGWLEGEGVLVKATDDSLSFLDRQTWQTDKQI